MSHQQLDSSFVFIAAGVIPMLLLGPALIVWEVLPPQDAMSLGITVSLGIPLIVFLLRVKWPDVGEEFLVFQWWVLTIGSIAAMGLRLLVGY